MPDFSTAYRGLVSSLEGTLRDPSVVQHAHEALAGMIEAIELRPDACAQHGYAITLRGKPRSAIRRDNNHDISQSSAPLLSVSMMAMHCYSSARYQRSTSA